MILANRRWRLGLALAVVAAIVIGTPVARGDKAPVKVGLLLSYTGVLGMYGPEMTKAIELYLKHIGGTVADHPVQLVREDDEGKPDVALTKVRKLVERDRVSFIIGPVNSAVALAVRAYLDTQKAPTVVPIAYTR